MGPVDKVINGMLLEKIDDLEQILESDIFFYYGPLDDGMVRAFISMLESLAERGGKREGLSIVLTTAGGSAFAVERMVNIIRHYYDKVDFFIPEYAYSAGTIFCMSGDNIYMSYGSVLGPIDPQVKNKDNKWVPALNYLDKINELLTKARDGTISQAEFLILREFDLAEIRQYEQARDLTIELLKNWLVKYKFRTWKTRKSNGNTVTDAHKKRRAEKIAKQLGDSNLWLSHARPIGLDQLRNLELVIEDYGENKPLKKALDEYYQLLSDYIVKNGATICMQTRTGGVIQ